MPCCAYGRHTYSWPEQTSPTRRQVSERHEGELRLDSEIDLAHCFQPAV